jgi:hypothetical protein
MSDKELDNLFKEAADGFKPPNDPAAWQDMSRKLDAAAATTASFWNWKTISSAVVVGVAVVALTIYLSVSDFNQNEIASSDVTQPSAAKQQAADATPPGDNSSETERTKQSVTKKNSIAIEKQNQPERNNGSAADEKRGVKSTGKKSATQDSGVDGIQLETIPEQNSQSMNGAKEIKDSDGRSVTAVISGTVGTEKLVKQAGGHRPAGGELGNSSNPASNSKELKTESLLVSADQNGKSATKAELTEKPVVQSGSDRAGATEPSSSNDSALNLKGSKGESIAVSEDKKVETFSRVVGTESWLQSSGSGKAATPENGLNQTATNTNASSNAQSVSVETDSLKIKEIRKEEDVTDQAAEKLASEQQEEKPAFSRFAIKLAIGPDYTMVESATPNSVGTNYGLLFEYRLNKYWSVATGGIWSKKIYSAYDVEYNGYNADWVDGDCRMWDIPINVYYNFSSSKSFSFYASIGLSSYLMNEENYVYYVETPYGTYDYPGQVKGENNEWFKTFNISAGMQFRMSQQFSLQFEPTLKAPLAGVGEGEVSLVSLGAFFNLRYEFPINKRKRNED